jgi:hypothetical protein
MALQQLGHRGACDVVCMDFIDHIRAAALLRQIKRQIQ